MKTLPPFTIGTILALAFSSCARSPQFDIRLVNAVSGAPIGGATVDHKTTRFKWPNQIVSNTHLGKTDEEGIFAVGSLDLDSVHRLTIYKPGFINRYVHVRGRDGGAVYQVTGGNNYTKLMPISESMTVEVRTTRGREKRKRTPLFAPTAGAWWETPEKQEAD